MSSAFGFSYSGSGAAGSGCCGCLSDTGGSSLTDSAQPRRATRCRVTFSVVVAAPVAPRPLDERRHPAAVPPRRNSLDRRHPAADRREAGQALVARPAVDLDADGAALVAEAERAGVAVDGHDGALELPS